MSPLACEHFVQFPERAPDDDVLVAQQILDGAAPPGAIDIRVLRVSCGAVVRVLRAGRVVRVVRLGADLPFQIGR